MAETVIIKRLSRSIWSINHNGSPSVTRNLSKVKMIVDLWQNAEFVTLQSFPAGSKPVEDGELPEVIQKLSLVDE